MTRLAILWFVLGGVVAQGATVTPVVEGPIPSVAAGDPSRNYPWAATDVDLAGAGFVEEEFFFTGEARHCLGTGCLEGTHPYRSRMIVRRPAAARRFNGTVIVEWLNVTDQRDGDYDWLMLSDHILRAGYAWVGVSAQRVGIDAPVTGLKAWSPSRYGGLDVTAGGTIVDDGLAFDVFSQAGAALRSPGAVDPLGPLRKRKRGVERLIATGHSQSAILLTPYINTAHADAGVYDGFILHSTGGRISPDVDTRTFHLRAESDVRLFPRHDDDDRVRTWEVAGTSHFDWRQESGRTGVLVRDLGFVPPPPQPCDLPYWTRVPFHHVFAAAVDHLVEWIAKSTPPPHAEPIAVTGTTIVRDAAGHVSGGIRLADYEVPTADNSGGNRGMAAFCADSLIGSYAPYSAATLATLYPRRRAYVKRVRSVAKANQRDGFIVRADATATIRAARVSDIGD
ncbi:MAG TPA: alpha/beta hydrolase domain-containing protein [Candidatus Binatia bacterium]|jgi:hypothetical protein|nr:alpha/beta hydrolase domain-containing protein [Candidatus Binatia bacterium]